MPALSFLSGSHGPQETLTDGFSVPAPLGVQVTLPSTLSFGVAVSCEPADSLVLGLFKGESDWDPRL